MIEIRACKLTENGFFSHAVFSKPDAPCFPELSFKIVLSLIVFNPVEFYFRSERVVVLINHRLPEGFD